METKQVFRWYICCKGFRENMKCLVLLPFSMRNVSRLYFGFPWTTIFVRRPVKKWHLSGLTQQGVAKRGSMVSRGWSCSPFSTGEVMFSILHRGPCSPNFVPQTKWSGGGASHPQCLHCLFLTWVISFDQSHQVQEPDLCATDQILSNKHCDFWVCSCMWISAWNPRVSTCDFWLCLGLDQSDQNLEILDRCLRQSLRKHLETHPSLRSAPCDWIRESGSPCKDWLTPETQRFLALTLWICAWFGNNRREAGSDTWNAAVLKVRVGLAPTVGSLIMRLRLSVSRYTDRVSHT